MKSYFFPSSFIGGGFLKQPVPFANEFALDFVPANDTYGTSVNMPWEGEAKIAIFVRYKADAETSSTYVFRQNGLCDFNYRPSTINWDLMIGGVFRTLTIPKAGAGVDVCDALIYDGVTMSCYRIGNTTAIASAAFTGTIGTTANKITWGSSDEVPNGKYDGCLNDFWVVRGDINILNDIPRIGLVAPVDPELDPLWTTNDVYALLMGDNPSDDPLVSVIPVANHVDDVDDMLLNNFTEFKTL